MSDQTRFILNETDLPKAWYNVLADSPVPATKTKLFVETNGAFAVSESLNSSADNPCIFRSRQKRSSAAESRQKNYGHGRHIFIDGLQG